MIRENQNDALSPNETQIYTGENYSLAFLGGKLKGLFCMDPQLSFNYLCYVINGGVISS
jgi:hypothetical protein